MSTNMNKLTVIRQHPFFSFNAIPFHTPLSCQQSLFHNLLLLLAMLIVYTMKYLSRDHPYNCLCLTSDPGVFQYAIQRGNFDRCVCKAQSEGGLPMSDAASLSLLTRQLLFFYRQSEDSRRLVRTNVF